MRNLQQRKKVTQLGNSTKNERMSKCSNGLTTSSCIVMGRYEDEPADSMIQDGEGLNECIYAIQKDIIGLRRIIKSLQGELRTIKEKLNNND